MSLHSRSQACRSTKAAPTRRLFIPSLTARCGNRALTAAWPWLACTLLLAPITGLTGCWSADSRDVVVYTALDREFSEPVFVEAEQTLPIQVVPKYDTESTKTVGLVTRLMLEAKRPQCDLFWNNEILHTLRLKRMGLLRPINLPDADSFPAQYRDPEGCWYGFAARARVLIVNTQQFPDASQRPSRLEDLIDSSWQTPRAIAKPLFGTTATHAAVLRARWGAERFETFFAQVQQQATVVSGNKQVATGVASGEFGFGLTDTDDAIVEIEKGAPVTIVFPDQQPDGRGTLLIPNTLACLQGSPSTDAAETLAAYLLSAQVEQRLAETSSAQIPLHQSIQFQSRVLELADNPDTPPRWMTVDFAAAADEWDETIRFLDQTFSGDTQAADQ